MFLGIDIGGTKCAVSCGDSNGIIEKKSFKTTDRDTALGMILATAESFSLRYEISACGVSCGGPLDEKRGLILSPPNLPGWDRVAICDKLEKALQLPCGLRNDANACAMAEYYFGAGKGTENMVFMTFGTGLGAGIIANGKLLTGANGFAGELGHIRLAEFGPAGYGKCGSFEGFCSGTGLAALGQTVARSARQQGIEVSWTPIPEEIAAAARAGDRYAMETFELCGRMLGRGLAIVMDLFNPEKIVIGSIFARCRDLLEPAMEEELKKEALPQTREACVICPPLLGEQIGDMAAIAVAMEMKNELY